MTRQSKCCITTQVIKYVKKLGNDWHLNSKTRKMFQCRDFLIQVRGW